jgi:hypothetical protein
MPIPFEGLETKVEPKSPATFRKATALVGIAPDNF